MNEWIYIYWNKCIDCEKAILRGKHELDAVSGSGRRRRRSIVTLGLSGFRTECSRDQQMRRGKEHLELETELDASTARLAVLQASGIRWHELLFSNGKEEAGIKERSDPQIKRLSTCSI